MARKRTTTPRIPDDARAQRSLEALRAAFLDLIETKPLDQITIKQITDHAGLSYPTFFRRFAGKEDLLADIAAVEARHLMMLGMAAMGHQKNADSTYAICAYVAQHRPLWRALLTGGAAGAVRAEFVRIAHEINSTRARTNPWAPEDLIVPFVTSGIFEILAWWMRQDDDYPVKNVVTLFNALITDVVARPRNITLD